MDVTDVDVAAIVKPVPLSDEEARKLRSVRISRSDDTKRSRSDTARFRNKIDWHIMPLMCSESLTPLLNLILTFVWFA